MDDSAMIRIRKEHAMVQQIVDGIADLNVWMGIWSLLLPAIFALAVLWALFRCYRNPSQTHTRILLAIYAVIYVFARWTILMGRDVMGLPTALGGAIGLWTVSLLLVLDIFFHWTEVRMPEQTGLKILSWSLIVTGIFLYPVVEMLLGFTYPRMVFFGAECPTTISLIGLFIGAVPRVNKILFVLVSINAIFTGGYFAIHGAWFDYLYMLAGLLGSLVLLIHFREIFLKK